MTGGNEKGFRTDARGSLLTQAWGRFAHAGTVRRGGPSGPGPDGHGIALQPMRVGERPPLARLGREPELTTGTGRYPNYQRIA